MLTVALLTSPVTPAALLTQLARDADHLTSQEAAALASHPNLPADHPVLTSGALADALADPTIPADRAARIAASLSDLALSELLLETNPHPAVLDRTWSLRREPWTRPAYLERIATCPTTPPKVVACALRAAVADPRGMGVRGLVWAATAHPHLLGELAATCPDPALADALADAAARPDPRGHATGELVTRIGRCAGTWAQALAQYRDAVAPAALADGDPEALAAVVRTAGLDARTRVQALTALAKQRHFPRSTTTAADETALLDIAGHLTDDDMGALLTPDALPCWVVTALLTGPQLGAGPLEVAWQGVAADLDAREGDRDLPTADLVFAALTIAAHPACPAQVRTDALEAAQVMTRGQWWTMADRALVATVIRVLAGPTAVRLPALPDPASRWQTQGGVVLVNLTRILTAALTPGLRALAGDETAARTAAALLPEFRGTWDELVTTAGTVAA